MRRFEQGERYWEVNTLGARVEMRWGATAGAAQTFGRTFGTEGEAEVFAERQIIAQRERGYVEVTESVVDVAPEVIAQRHQRFEDSTSFVEVTQEGMKLTVRGGRIVGGKDVVDRERLHVQHYTQVAEASAAFDERCSRIRHQGARVVEAEPTHAFHTNLALEAQCDASLDSAEPWVVYADWLIAHGDARGEIAALQRAGRATEANRVLGTHLRELCGTDSGTLAFTYRHGFAITCAITVEPDGPDLLEDVTRMVLASPMGRFLEKLTFGLASVDGDNDWGPTIHIVGDSVRGPHVRALVFDFEHQEQEFAHVPVGDFSAAWQRLPALRRLAIKGASCTLGTLDLPNLESFTRICGGLSHAELDAILTARWPRLAHLELWLGAHEYGAEATVSSLAPLLAARGVPALRSLGICDCELLDDLIPELARSKVLPQLTALDLSHGTLGRDGAAAMIVHAEAFRHLASINLDNNYLRETDCEQLHRLLPSAAFGKQRDDHDDEPPYAAIGE